VLRPEPATGIEALDVGAALVATEPLPEVVRSKRHVVHHDEPGVGGGVHVELDTVGTELHRSSEGRLCVLGSLDRRAAMAVTSGTVRRRA
jgi:hypothetical protein